MHEMTMVTPLHESSALPQKERPIRLRRSDDAEPHGEARARLQHLLQMSLELDDVLQTFFDGIQAIIACHGLEYQHDTQDIQWNCGHASAHSCDYRLNTPNGHMGQIVFSRKRRFSDNELATIEMLLGVLIYPLQNALRYREAVQTALIDPLTGTGNRVAMDNALHRELQMSQRYDTDLAMLVIDIDHFKHINDEFGHSAGDDILKGVAHTIESVSRETDMTFRYGGEEFVVLLSKTDAEGMAVIAERIRESIETADFYASTHKVNITVSIGGTNLQCNDHITHFFDRADQALYQAKHQGRNRVAVTA